MKSIKNRYISYSVRFMFLYLSIFIMLLLLLVTVIFVSEGYIILPVFGCYLLYGCFIYFYYKKVYIPYKITTKVMLFFADGYILQGVFDQQYYLSPEIEKTMNKFKEILDMKELLSASKKQAEYLALQNQINPHFLYNTLEGIRGETLQAGLENVAKMTEALATFFRYTISNVEHLVTLEDELHNIDNYYIIQQYRFGDRLSLETYMDKEDEKELLKYGIPKLTLQPIIENAIYHGVERKLGKGTIYIKIESTSKRLIITVSDNGLGIEEERLIQLNNKLNNMSFEYIEPNNEVKGGIAMVNVNRRIKLLFGEQYGITIFSTLNVGTDVEVTLPLLKKV